MAWSRRPVLLSLLVTVTLGGGLIRLAPAASQAAESADVSITKSGPETGEVGTDVTYVLTASNLGPDRAEDVVVTDDLPPGAVRASATTTKGSCSGADPVVCNVGTLAAGEEATITIVATPTVAGPALDEASVSSRALDPLPSNNTDSLTTQVEGKTCTVVGSQGDDEIDTFAANDVICGLGGSDEIDADGGSNTVYGGSGADAMTADSGSDTFDGGAGVDTVSYAEAENAVDVDLGEDSATGWGSDALPAIQDVTGSPKSDLLDGDGAANKLVGGDGVDLLWGRAANDDLFGGAKGDYLNGGDGDDDLFGGGGVDACTSGQRTSCLSTSPKDPNDASGKLDIKKVKTVFGSSTPKWRIVTRSTWTANGIWDDGFFIVLLDTQGDSAVDFYAMGRSNGNKMKGHLFRKLPGPDVLKGGLSVGRPNARTLRITIPLWRVNVATWRNFFRWSVRTMSMVACQKVCFDSVPPPPGRLVQPVP